MTTADRIRAKVTRANQHIEDFQLRAAAFYRAKPYVGGIYEDTKAGQRVYYIASLKELPETLAAIAADALQNLRSPLDYLASQIETAACKAKPKHLVYFPIGRDAAHYVTVRRAYIKCAGQAAIDAFDATEPYKGGKGHALWQLHQLNKPDKHHFPLAIAGSYAAFDAGVIMRDAMRRNPPDWLDVDSAIKAMPPLFIQPADRLCPLKEGDHLFKEPLDTEVHEPRKFVLQISFNEPGIIECEPVLKTLKDLSDLIGGVVDAFEPLLP